MTGEQSLLPPRPRPEEPKRRINSEILRLRPENGQAEREKFSKGERQLPFFRENGILMSNQVQRGRGEAGKKMLHQAFVKVYTKFKLHFYQEIFRRFQDREASLTTMETFCMESIQALGSPTVNEFASFMRISPPNAAYKVNSLVKKGYIRKVQSPDDRREYHLELTQKYIDYYNISSDYLVTVMERVASRFSPEDCARLERMLVIVSRELMPEVRLPKEAAEE